MKEIGKIFILPLFILLSICSCATPAKDEIYSSNRQNEIPYQQQVQSQKDGPWIPREESATSTTNKSAPWILKRETTTNTTGTSNAIFSERCSMLKEGMATEEVFRLVPEAKPLFSTQTMQGLGNGKPLIVESSVGTLVFGVDRKLISWTAR